MEAERSMMDLTWRSMEAAGIPDSGVRQALFDLARRLDDKPGGDDLALVSAAFRALDAVLREHYRPQSALEVQIETLKTQRELRQLLNADLPDIEFSASDFELPPTTTVELAISLGYDDGGRAVRRVLRSGFPDHVKNDRWGELSQEQINYVRAHLRPRT